MVTENDAEIVVAENDDIYKENRGTTCGDRNYTEQNVVTEKNWASFRASRNQSFRASCSVLVLFSCRMNECFSCLIRFVLVFGVVFICIRALCFV